MTAQAPPPRAEHRFSSLQNPFLKISVLCFTSLSLLLCWWWWLWWLYLLVVEMLVLMLMFIPFQGLNISLLLRTSWWWLNWLPSSPDCARGGGDS